MGVSAHTPSLEVFKKRLDVPLRDMVSSHGDDGLGLDAVISELFSNVSLCLYDSTLWNQAQTADGGYTPCVVKGQVGQYPGSIHCGEFILSWFSFPGLL